MFLVSQVLVNFGISLRNFISI